MPVPVWKTDVEKFCQAVNPLITADNESYAVVMLGSCKRGGAGLSMECGVTSANQVIHIFATSQKDSLICPRAILPPCYAMFFPSGSRFRWHHSACAQRGCSFDPVVFASG
jgi:hypothetical protein